jgi:putative transposase
MSNHIHLLLTPATGEGISHLMQFLGRQYVQAFNFKYSKTGTHFEGRFKSTLVQDQNYLLNCIQYIELNPVRAGMTSDPGDYQWCSDRSHAFGRPAKMWTAHR